MALMQFEAVHHDSKRTEPVFIDPLDVVSIRGGGGAWAGKVTLIKTKHEVPEIAVRGSVSEIGARVLGIQVTGQN